MVQAAATLLAEGGREAVSTRAVSAAAGVQSPSIYRQFGDMRGLLDAVVSHGFNAYLEGKAARPPADDPVDDLREGWRMNVEFGLANPALYTLMYGEPGAGSKAAAAEQADALLHGLVQRIAKAGRLRVSVERAERMMHAGAVGVTFVLLDMPPEERDLELSETTREAILAAITTDSVDEHALESTSARAAARAVALKAVLDDNAAGLTVGEQSLLREWLDRIAAQA
jgi:AcrR family transcriptional regulator